MDICKDFMILTKKIADFLVVLTKTFDFSQIIYYNDNSNISTHHKMRRGEPTMYSLLIAEDERVSRERLHHMIKWEELGFQVLATFADGQEVLDYLKYNTVDVILTDIKMTHVSGLDVANYVASQNLPIQVVLLSGYEEFEYAKRALEYRVADYLSKPISLPKLKETFRRIAEQFDRSNQQSMLREQQITHYNQLINYEKQQLITDVYYGAETDPKKIEARLKLLQGMAHADCYLLQLSFGNNSRGSALTENYGSDELSNQISQVMEATNPNYEFYPISQGISDADGTFNTLGVLWEKAPSAEEKGTEQIPPTPQGITSAMAEYLSIKANVTLCQKLSSPVELSRCHERVGENTSGEMLMQNMEYLQLLREQNMLLSSYLREGDRTKGLELCKALLSNLLRGGIHFAQRQCFYTVTKLIDNISAGSISRQNALYLQYATPDIYNLVQPENIGEWLENRVAGLFDFESNQAGGKVDKSIDRIMAYIQAHFSEDISLNIVAEAVYLHPAYISRLIKERTGKTFSALVTDLRIEKAIALLENSHLRVYEIAEQSGFSNLKYFYKVFKELTGKSPSDYRASPQI